MEQSHPNGKTVLNHLAVKRHLFPTPTNSCTNIHQFSVGLLYNTSAMIGVKARTGCAALSESSSLQLGMVVRVFQPL